MVNVNSALNIWYLDDRTLGGSLKEVLQDFKLIEEELGLVLNHSKSEVIAKDNPTRYTTLENYPDLSIIEPGQASLSSYRNPLEEFDSILESKVVSLETY